MNLKRAILLGIALWVIIFFEVSILMFGFGLTGGVVYYTVHYILAAVFLAIASMVYFKKAGSIKEGLFLGLIFIVVGAILDAAITVPLFVKDYSKFFNGVMLAGYLETLVVPVLVGILKGKK
jgi:hypothetical protein